MRKSPAMVVPNKESVKKVVLSGFGVGIVDYESVKYEIESGEVIPVIDKARTLSVGYRG